MATNTSLEERLTAIEAAIAELQKETSKNSLFEYKCFARSDTAKKLGFA